MSKVIVGIDISKLSCQGASKNVPVWARKSVPFWINFLPSFHRLKF